MFLIVIDLLLKVLDLESSYDQYFIITMDSIMIVSLVACDNVIVLLQLSLLPF